MADTVEIARKLRRAQTDAEICLWSKLRNRQLLGVKFRRQYPINPYIADFFAEDYNLIIELDGGQHTPEADADRTALLEKQGYRIVRFWNHDVLSNTEGVLETIGEYLKTPCRMNKHMRAFQALEIKAGLRPDIISPHPAPLPWGEGI